MQLYVVRNYDFKTISDKELETNFVRMKVSELKKYLQSVLQKSVAKTCGFVCKSSRACHQAYFYSEAVKSVWTLASR